MKLAWLIIPPLAAVVVACGSSSNDTASPTAAATQPGTTPPPTAAASPTPKASDSTTNVTATSLSAPKSVARGANATVRAGTAPNAKCTIVYKTPAGTASDAAGLEAKTADAKGEVSWTFVVGPGTSTGTASVKVTCDGQSASADIAIT